jgi:hypothetical protein
MRDINFKFLITEGMEITMVISVMTDEVLHVPVLSLSGPKVAMQLTLAVVQNIPLPLIT